MKKNLNILCLLLLSSVLFNCSVAQKPSSKTFNVLQYGVVADGKTVNTTAIQKLIDDCSKNGGGIVSFPAGQFVSGTILLKDNVTLSLHENTELLGSTNIADYQLVDPFKTGNGAPMGYCFIGAVDAKNVGLIGKGKINGRGPEVLASGGRGKRPFLVRFVRTTGITVKDVKLLNSTAWTAHFFACKGINIDGVSIRSRGLGNNDGFDIDCSQDVKITNCDIDTGDDGLCFKSTSSKMACKNIEVKGLRITSNHGGIKFGTESMAPFENIKISDIYIYDTNNGGIKLNTVDGAHLRNVEISNVVMENVKTVLFFRLGSRLNVFKEGESKQPTGTIENVTIKNVKAKMPAKTQLDPPTGILMTGVPGHYIKNVTLENIEFNVPGGGTAEDARFVVAENENAYPEISRFKPKVPAYGIWARHVDGLTLKDIKIKLEGADLRPAIVVQDGKNVRITESTLPVSTGMESVIRLENVVGATVKDINSKGNAQSFVRVEGKQSQGVVVSDNDIAGIGKELVKE